MASSSHSSLSIVHVTSEIAPIAKVGGLGDVVYGLAIAAKEAGHQVEVWLPKYATLHTTPLSYLKKQATTETEATLWSAQLNGLNLMLIELKNSTHFFMRDSIYGWPDDVERFTAFIYAVITNLRKRKQLPDVIHLHDWPTALVASLVRALKWTQTKVIFTIHSVEHQGRCLPHQVALTSLYDLPTQDPPHTHDLNLLKAGIRDANYVATVSPNYLNEILTPLGGHGLDRFLNQHKPKLHAILNGIDYNYWNPATDPLLPYTYSAMSLENRAHNKRTLQKQLGLKEGTFPLVAVISRLVPQKGPHLIEYGLRYALKMGAQVVLLGSSPTKEIQSHFKMVKHDLEGYMAKICLEYNEPLAHLLYAGADFIFIPSLFEPCGLTQMIGLRYGTVPIARATGGLKDTVFDFETSKLPQSQRNGFTFDFPDEKGVDWGLGRALTIFNTNPMFFQELQKQGMQQDFSWKHSFEDYLRLYTRSDKAARI